MCCRIAEGARLSQDIIISDSNPITRLNTAPVEMSLFQIEEQNAAWEASFDLPCREDITFV